ncbi:hypothetical protein ROZALSC1DRAFT_25046 [Rozella allomycis CSF55]|uniref:Uncharacterized protein n=1 Tax=Rozella allomycis (strain CSF55) TaxID=988480 RepID=A0A4P9YBG3_ROZAC|nr:hypothetical protein ROZALSC1DRAFT_25046 [Rozella allomycis CSF55]
MERVRPTNKADTGEYMKLLLIKDETAWSGRDTSDFKKDHFRSADQRKKGAIDPSECAEFSTLGGESRCLLDEANYQVIVLGMVDVSGQFYLLCLALSSHKRQEEYEILIGGCDEILFKFTSGRFCPGYVVSDGILMVRNYDQDTVKKPIKGINDYGLCYSKSTRSQKTKLTNKKQKLIGFVPDLNAASSGDVDIILNPRGPEKEADIDSDERGGPNEKRGMPANVGAALSFY